MGYKLIPPGRRRNNATWIVRGSIGGRRFEARSDATTKAAAEEWALKYIDGLQRESGAAAGAVLTFAQAAAAYIALKRPRLDDERNILLLGRWFADRPLDGIRGADLVAAAHALKPGAGDATKNRAIITPGSAVLHYASEQGWCAYARHRRLKVSRRSPRRPASEDTLRLLLANTEGHKHVLLSWLYETGLRISDSLALHDSDLDLRRNRVRVGSSKTDDHGELGISPELVALLANTPRCRGGRVFPWRDRHGVYRWLRPLVRRLGLVYTPHLSRHALATDLRALGWDMRGIAERGLWRDERSAGRYTHHRAADTPGRSVGILMTKR
jgi:integrase